MSLYKRLLAKVLARSLSVPELDELRKLVAQEAQGKVAEIGFGAGYNCRFYDSEKVSEVIGIEPSEFESSKYSENPPYPVSILQESGENISITDNSIDTCVSFLTLCSVDSIEQVLSEAFRILKPGGRLIILDHGIYPDGILRPVQHLCTPCTKWTLGGCRLNRDILQSLHASDFEIITSSHPDWKKGPLAHLTFAIGEKKVQND